MSSGLAASLSPLAEKPALPSMLVDLAGLERAYYDRRPEPEDPAQRVRFGTGGHRGSPFHGSFTEAHIVAITQATRPGTGSSSIIRTGAYARARWPSRPSSPETGSWSI